MGGLTCTCGTRQVNAEVISFMVLSSQLSAYLLTGGGVFALLGLAAKKECGSGRMMKRAEQS